jgi:lipid-binding SYLF domain-containing protein
MHHLLLITFLVTATPVHADWRDSASGKVEQRAALAVERMQTRLERSRQYYDDAYAYAVFPGITRVGLGFGGAYGKGVVVEGDAIIGRASYWQFTSGIQAGAKNFALLLFFKDQAALVAFKTSDIQFMGQAGVDLATVAVNGTPTYSDGVAIIAMPNLGLMAEFTISGAKINFRPEDAAED